MRKLLPNPQKLKKCSVTLGVFIIYTILPQDECIGDVIAFLNNIRPQIHEKIDQEIKDKCAIKWYAVIQVDIRASLLRGSP